MMCKELSEMFQGDYFNIKGCDILLWMLCFGWMAIFFLKRKGMVKLLGLCI